MLRTIIINPDQDVADELRAAIAATGIRIEVSRVVDHYLSGVDLLRVLRAHAPDILFLSFEDTEQALATVRFLDAHGQGLPVIATRHSCDAALLRETMRSGIRE